MNRLVLAFLTGCMVALVLCAVVLVGTMTAACVMEALRHLP